MEDTSFIRFTDDRIIERIDIDPRLIDSFKRVMKKMQAYFNANGYTSQRNYKEYLEKYLLNSNDKNMRFYVGKIERKGVIGFYAGGVNFDRKRNEICIKEEILKRSSEVLDSTLCHEFIHFLVMHGLEYNQADSDIVRGGFINEALTEMLTQQMYPGSESYDAQVAMQKFANLVSGKENNFSRFLQGFVDARYSSPDWENYRRFSNAFQSDFEEAGYINLLEAQNNSNFIQAQRRLISLFMRPKGEKNINEYIETINKLLKRPVADTDYINNQVVAELDKALISSLRVKDSAMQLFLQKKLQELRSQIAISKQNNGKSVYEFEFEGRKLAIDSDYNLHGDLINIVRSWSPKEGVMKLTIHDKSLSLNMNEIDFNAREREIAQKITEISHYFTKESSTDLSFISKAARENAELTKLEKFTIPILDSNTKQKSRMIYVATYKDRIAILSSASNMGVIENVELNRYIGMTSNNPKVAMIYADKIGKISKGALFSVLNEKTVETKAIDSYIDQLADSLSQEQINQLVVSYKNSDDFFEGTEEDIKYEAVRIAASQEFANLADEKKKKLLDAVKDESTKFVVSTKDGKIDVSYVFAQKPQTAYQGKREVLYDLNGMGMYNEVYDSISKNIEPNTTSSKQTIPIDDHGNMILEDAKANRNSVVEDEIFGDFFAEYAQNLDELRGQYGVIEQQMNALMKKNDQNPIANYQGQLNKLMDQRNNISKRMSALLHRQSDLKQKEEDNKVENTRAQQEGSQAFYPNEFSESFDRKYGLEPLEEKETKRNIDHLEPDLNDALGQQEIDEVLNQYEMNRQQIETIEPVESTRRRM